MTSTSSRPTRTKTPSSESAVAEATSTELLVTMADCLLLPCPQKGAVSRGSDFCFSPRVATAVSGLCRPVDSSSPWRVTDGPGTGVTASARSGTEPVCR
ncbi:UNVERIFIED_CONTAM: hypothetical protein LK11_45515 [Mumia flava]